MCIKYLSVFLFVCVHCFAVSPDLNIDFVAENRKVLSSLNNFKVDESYTASEKDTSVTCNETQVCRNGGSCLQYSCLCLPGTSGPLCEIIDDCENELLCRHDRYTDCRYSVELQKAYCDCRIREFRFDIATRTCRDCLCEKKSATLHQNTDSFSYCEYKQGQQICTCTEGYVPTYDTSDKKVTCEACVCNSNSTWCGFDEEGRKMCGCEEGYFFNGEECIKCVCGSHGICDRKVTCICEEGYVERNGVCIECSCGKYGTCLFDEHNKQIGCKCETGYTLSLGKCEKCYCGDNANCTFNGTEKVCDCESGYEDANGFCADLNECEKHNPCNESMTCINLPGTYECICKDGYTPVTVQMTNKTTEICQDVDECYNSSVCTQPNTFCENTIGSFNCLCMSGYISRGMLDSAPSCEESTARKIYIFISLVAFALLLMLGTAAYHLKKAFDTNNPYNQHEMK